MRAFEEYKEMGDAKFEAAMQDKRILGAAQSAYAIAAENGMKIIKMLNDPTSDESKDLTVKLKQCFQLAESIKAKRENTPGVTSKQVFMSQFN